MTEMNVMGEGRLHYQMEIHMMVYTNLEREMGKESTGKCISWTLRSSSLAFFHGQFHFLPEVQI